MGHGDRRRAISIHVPLAGNVITPGSLPGVGAFISIHVPLAGNVTRRKELSGNGRSVFLSTFPLRGTSWRRPVVKGQYAISIHVPLAGNVAIACSSSASRVSFLSTFPLRGTSLQPCSRPESPDYFYPRSPCGERLYNSQYHIHLLGISIHVPLAGNVNGYRDTRRASQYFYPRSPCGERPAVSDETPPRPKISIHVPLAGNVRTRARMGAGIDISIHVPLAGNVIKRAARACRLPQFLSTFPLRGTSCPDR